MVFEKRINYINLLYTKRILKNIYKTYKNKLIDQQRFIKCNKSVMNEYKYGHCQKNLKTA